MSLLKIYTTSIPSDDFDTLHNFILNEFDSSIKDEDILLCKNTMLIDMTLFEEILCLLQFHNKIDMYAITKNVIDLMVDLFDESKEYKFEYLHIYR